MVYPDDVEQDEAESTLLRLLSVMSWREQTGFAVAHRTGGSWPMMMQLARQGGFATRQPFDFTDLVWPEENAPRIALALMREGQSLNHAAYAFLSYWRVVELAFPKGRERTSWMQQVLPTLSGHDVTPAIETIATVYQADVCAHLYESGRCAIAHAGQGSTVDPDDPRDARRLACELPLVRAFAVRAVEDRYGIMSPAREFKEHLYELRGWKEALGTSLVHAIQNDQEISDDQTIDLPAISVRLRGQLPYDALNRLLPAEARIENRRLDLYYRTEDGLLALRFCLDFENERLIFDPKNGVYMHDNGTRAAAQYKVDVQRFMRDLFLNGEIRMLDADTQALISRRDAFIPVNVFVDLDNWNAIIDEGEAEVKRRRM